MSEAASYDLRVHPRARAELRQFDGHVVDALTDELVEVAQERQPSSHPSVKHVEGSTDFLRVKVDGVRAICRLHKPEFRVLLVDKRRAVYDRLDVAAERSEVVG